MSHPAHYNDGKTAERHTVTCAVGNRALAIIGKTGAVLDRWPVDEIRAASAPGRFRRVGAEARLSLLPEDGGAWLTDHCPNLKKGDNPKGMAKTWAIAAVLAILSLGGIVVFLIPAFANIVVQAVPLTLERQIGEQTRDQIIGVLGRFGGEGAPRVCRAAGGQAILDRHAAEIEAVLESPFDVTVTVLRFPVANAFALPGGEVLILSGLLDDAENGDEVIGVLAHEIAHVVRRDALTVTLQQTGTALLVSLLIGDVFGGAVLSGIGTTLLETGYSREAETAADDLAVRALNQLGLTARPLAAFLSRLSDQSELEGSIPEFLSTHPASAGRAERIVAASIADGRSMTSVEWNALRTMCR